MKKKKRNHRFEMNYQLKKTKMKREANFEKKKEEENQVLSEWLCIRIQATLHLFF